MKKNILILIVGLIIGSSITVLAGSYNAKQISYTPSDNTWNVTNVKDAVDDLKSKSKQEIKFACASWNVTGDAVECMYFLPSNHNYKTLKIKNIETQNVYIDPNWDNSIIIGESVSKPIEGSTYNVTNNKVQITIYGRSSAKHGQMTITLEVE